MPSNGDARSKSLISLPAPSPNQRARTRTQRPIRALHMPKAALHARPKGKTLPKGQCPNTRLHWLVGSPEESHCHLLSDHGNAVPGVPPDSQGHSLARRLKYRIWKLPWWLSGEKSACQFRTHGFNPRLGKTPQAAEQLCPCATTTEPVL